MMWKIICIILSFFAFCACLVINTESISNNELAQPRVNLSGGEIEGILFTTAKGKKAYVFQGIPYAEPPLQHLRFAKPAPKSPWNGTLPCNAGYKPVCPQNVSVSQYANQSEDCLYLNVFSGLECFEKDLYNLKCPVLYYVHGGANEFESPAMFPTEDLVDNVASDGVVLITVAYRLGILGFFSTGLDDAPGNWALEDMIEGARWVQREIENFGGDHNRVTIMGHSSSATAVSLLAMSQKTRGLFQRAVVMSGSGVVWNAIWNDVTDYLNLANLFNCTSETEAEKRISMSGDNGSFEILNCLRKIDAQSLVNNFNEIRGIDPDGFLPRNLSQARNDGTGGLFPLPLPEIIARRRPIEFMTGNTKTEYGLNKMFLLNAGPITVAESCTKAVDHQGNIKQKKKISKACTTAYTPKPLREKPRAESEKFSPEDLVNPINQTVHFSVWTQRSVAVSEDLDYYAPCHLEVSSLLKNGGKTTKVYLYSFDYEKEHLEGIFPWHAADLSFVLGSHKLNGTLTEEDLKVQSVYLPLFLNFIKYGDPTPHEVNGVRWKPLKTGRGTPYEYLSVNKVISMKTGYHEAASVFWNEIVPGLDNQTNVVEYQNWPFERTPIGRYADPIVRLKKAEGEIKLTKYRTSLTEKLLKILALYLAVTSTVAIIIFGALFVRKWQSSRRITDERSAIISSNLENFNGYDTL